MFRSKMSRRLATAAFLALFGVWALIAVSAIRFMRQQAQDAQHAGPAVEAVFALRDIPASSQVGESDIQVRPIELDQRHPGAAHSLADVRGKVAEQTIFAGEQVLLAKISDLAEFKRLAFKLPAGKRGVAISFDEVMGAGGLIMPGDWVDVIAVFDDDVRTAKEAGFVLQNVQVVAVARQVGGEQSLGDAGSEADAPSSAARGLQQAVQARSVTLAVTPEEAQRLVLAERFGKLKLVLRPLGSEQTLPTFEVTMDQVFLFEAVGATAANVAAGADRPTAR